MEVGEMDKKEPQVEVPWIPTTPSKPVRPKPAPICDPKEGIHLGHHTNGAVACFEFPVVAEKNTNSFYGSIPAATMATISSENSQIGEQGASANASRFTSFGFSQLLYLAEAGSVNSGGLLSGNNDGSNNPFIPSLQSQFSGDPHGTSYIGCCIQGSSPDIHHTLDNANGAESIQNASKQIDIEEPGPLGEEKNVTAKNLDNNGNPPNTELCDPVMEFAALSTSKDHNPDKGSSHDIDQTQTPQQKPRRKKHRPKVITEGKPKRTRRPATPKPVQSKENRPVKRKYVRKKGLHKTSTPTEVTGELAKEVSESVRMSCKKSLNFDMDARDECTIGRENAITHLGKETGLAVQETNLGLAHDLNTSIKQPSSNDMLISEEEQALNTSSSGNLPEAKPNEKATPKSKYARRRALNKTSASIVESTKKMIPESTKTSCQRSSEVGTGEKDEISAGKENATMHLGKEIGAVAQETNAGLPHDLTNSMKQASNNFMSSEDKQAPITSSKSNPPRPKAKENAIGKRNYAKRKPVNKSSTPIDMTAEISESTVPEYTNMRCRRSLNYDIGARDESSAGTENINVKASKENSVVVEETRVGITYDQSSSMMQSISDYMSLPEVTQAPSASPSKSNPAAEKPKGKTTGKRKYVKQSKLNNSPTPPTEMTAELTEPMTPESTIMSRSLNFELVARDESSASKQNSNVHISKEDTMLVVGTHPGLAYDQSTSMTQALYNFMSLPEETQAPNQSPSKSNPHGAKLDANSGENINKRNGQATAQDEHENSAKLLLKSGAQPNPNGSNISKSQSSTIRLQMVGSKRTHSGSIKCTDMSSMNEIGAHYNGFPLYQTKFRVQLPNVQKKKRSAKGKTSNTSVTSSETTLKEVQVTYAQEVARSHPYASSSSRWIFGPEYNAARVPTISEVTGVTHDTQTFEEFILSLRRLTERCSLPSQIGDCASLTGFTKFDVEPNYSAKQLGISDKQTSADAQRPQTCVDALVADTSASLSKKKRSKKRTALSSSASSKTNQMQQHHNFALGNNSLPMGKSLDFACEVIWKTMQNIDALAEQFSLLDINKEVRDPSFLEQNALVPYGQQHQNQIGLVNGNGNIIPFQGSFDPIKKHHPRPKVDLDEETDRVWKLLMLDINSHGIDGTDEEKAKRWEEERNVFRGRADSFIARMHLVQGDRRFSRWKGSVVDSVVGVYLTQNVSDHLSSSAFMSLAARFPKKPSTMFETYHGEGTSLVTKEPQVQMEEPEENTEWDAKILNQSVYDQNSVTIDIPEHSEEKEAVNSNGSCRTTSTIISSITEEGEEKSCCEGDGKESNDIVSSQCSVISSQISGDFSSDQNPEKIASCSDSNSEVEDLSSTAKYNSFYNSTSFSKLLEMASSSKLHEVNSQINKSTENSGDAYGHSIGIKHDNSTEILEKSNVTQVSLEASLISSHPIHKDAVRNEIHEISSAPIKAKSKGQGKEKKDDVNWDSLRIKAQAKAGIREKTEDTMDSLDWNAVRCADVNEISNTIKERGMNNRLAERIKNFLNRLYEEHGSIDLEWLRDVPPDQAKEYLLSFRGLGLKSVECVRLLTLHHLAFPVDTNVGRIAVRLGWVPLQPLPESLQLHLLELYPVLESIQKYLWPRLCKLDQRTLYELHYQMITFGKVFCTKSKPNCNACPMRGECRHFASAFASARLALPGPEQKSIVSTSGNNMPDQKPHVIISQLRLPLPDNRNRAEEIQQTEVTRQLEIESEINICQPIIEEPTTPEPECSQVAMTDIEDAFYEDSCEIPTIKLNMEEFTLNIQNYLQENMELQEGEMSKALVALNPEAASIPMPKLKNVSRLRTEHCVYELPDTHPLLEGWDRREPDDPGKYLLAIWTPGETANSIQPPESKCSSQECGQLCNEKECFSCNSYREANSQIVRGTLLIPCRTAMRGSFPLNGTYFQVNEVFADHDTSLNPISVPRSWIWNLNRRTVYFGTSVSSIFKGLPTQEIQQCFWRGYVCVRGFDRETRAPRPLMARLHFPASKMVKTKEKIRKESTPAKSKRSKPGPKQPELMPELISNGH